MSEVVVSSRVFLPSLAAELVDGWTVSEGSTFRSASGVEIRVRLDGVGQGWGLSDLIEHQVAAARAELVGIENMTETTVDLNGGRLAHGRRFDFDRDGVKSVGRFLCWVDDGLALTVSASWAADVAGADVEMDRLVAGIRLLNRPVIAPGVNVESWVGRGPGRRAPVEMSEWTSLRGVWAGSPPAISLVKGTTRWSPEELALYAAIWGSPSFPTVDSAVFSALPQVALSAVLESTMRSFVARGVVRSLDDGSTALVEDFETALEVALFPDLTILVESISERGVDVSWLGVRPHRAVQIVVLRDGSRECSELEPAAVVAHLLASGGHGDRGGGGSETTHGERSVTLDDVLDGSAGVASVVRVSTWWRVGDTLSGGVLTWAVGADGGLWLAEPTAPEGPQAWDLRSCDLGAVRAEVLDHLPGG